MQSVMSRTRRVIDGSGNEHGGMGYNIDGSGNKIAGRRDGIDGIECVIERNVLSML